MARDPLDVPFTLKLNVDQKNKPPSVSEVTSMSVRTTLRHKPSHLMHSIWLFSENHDLKPLFLKFSVDGKSVQSETPLSELLNTQEPSENLEMGLDIDYTLFGAPFLPKMPPVADDFEVSVTLTLPNAPEITAKCSRSLLDTVSSVKSKVSRTLGLSEDEMELSVPLDSGNLQDEAILRQAIGLDVPPLQAVVLEAKKRIPRYELRLFPLGDEASSVHIMIYASTTVCELREEVASTFGKDVRSLDLFFRTHCFSKATSVPSQVKLSELFSFADYTSHAPYGIGFQCIPESDISLSRGSSGTSPNEAASNTASSRGVEGFESTGTDSNTASNTASNGDGVSETETVFELEINGVVVKLSSSECEISGDHVRLSREAVTKLNEQWGLDVEENIRGSGVSGISDQLTPTVTESASEEGGRGSEPENEQSQPILSQNEEHRATVSENVMDNEVENRVESEEQVQRDQDQEQPNVSSPNATPNVLDTIVSNPTATAPAPNVLEPTTTGPSSTVIERAGGNVNPAQPGVRRGALQTIAMIVYQNRVLIIKSVGQVLCAMFLMIGPPILQLVQMTILVPLALCTIGIAYLSFGSDISTWIDTNILARLAPNTFDYMVVNGVSSGFRRAHVLNMALERRIEEWYLYALCHMRTKKYLAVEQRVFEHPGIVAVKSMGCDVVSCILMNVATILPVLEHSTSEFINDSGRHEEEEMRILIARYLKRLDDVDDNDDNRVGGDRNRVGDESRGEVRQRMQDRLSVPIESLVSDDSSHYADQLRLYLMLVWVVKRGKPLESMPAIK